jgi:hypothetical protein
MAIELKVSTTSRPRTRSPKPARSFMCPMARTACQSRSGGTRQRRQRLTYVVIHFHTEVEMLVELIVSTTVEPRVQEVHEANEIAALGQTRRELAQRKQKDNDEVRKRKNDAPVEAEAEGLSERTLDTAHPAAGHVRVREGPEHGCA